MNTLPINACAFSIKPHHEDAYLLNIEFNGEKSSHKEFTFIQESKSTETQIWDVLTKNGTLKKGNLINHLFRNKDVVQAQNIVNTLEDQKANGPHLVVLDLQDPTARYLPQNNSIAAGESVVAEFLGSKVSKGSNHPQAFLSLFKEKHPIQFMINEGSLKMDLLKKGGFSENEITYLNSVPAADTFCQITEVFMNAFKFGQSAKASGTCFQAKDYIKCLSENSEDFPTCQKSMVLYPPEYKDIYSPEGDFANKLSHSFAIKGGLSPETAITLWEVTKK